VYFFLVYNMRWKGNYALIDYYFFQSIDTLITISISCKILLFFMSFSQSVFKNFFYMLFSNSKIHIFVSNKGIEKLVTIIKNIIIHIIINK